MFYVIFAILGANIGAAVGSLVALGTWLLLDNLTGVSSRLGFDIALGLISFGGVAGFFGGLFFALKMRKEGKS